MLKRHNTKARLKNVYEKLHKKTGRKEKLFIKNLAQKNSADVSLNISEVNTQ